MKQTFFISAFFAVIAAGCLCGCAQKDESAVLNAAATKEYLKPIRPFTEGRNPCWNTYAKKFTFAPVFDFAVVDGAVKYLYTATSTSPSGEAVFSFTARTPHEALSEIWTDLPVGDVSLKVEALDKDGNVISVCGERKFFRDFPFKAPYSSNIRPYREAALMGMLYIHKMPQVQAWKTRKFPDMSYELNTYANKIIGNTVSVEAKVAKYFPEYRDEALAIARNAAAFLMAQSRPKGDRLAYFPPTYYGGLIASAKDWNQGKVMTMDPCYAANGFLDLYDVTGEKIYYDQALKIADTYASIQNEDGSFPIKCFFATGKPVNEAKAILHSLLNYIRRLDNQYDVHKYDVMRDKAARWMKEVALETFDLTGQFEDVNVEDVHPYENLTNSSAAPYASYILKGEPTPEDIEDARDLIRLSEDQFVHWNSLPDANGIRKLFGPCVFEQYRYETPVDNSSCNVANAFLDLYAVTKDPLAFAKAKALVDVLTIAQAVTHGYTPTTLDYRSPENEVNREFWLNCAVATINIFLRMADLTEE